MSSRSGLRSLLGLLAAVLLPACGNINQGHPILTFTELVSVGFQGQLSNGSSGQPAISADGRYVAFTSPATNLGYPNPLGHLQVYRRDLRLGITEEVSAGPGTGAGPVSGDDDSYRAAMSPDGRFVAFSSRATTLGVTNTTGAAQVYVRDMSQPIGSGLVMVSTTSAGVPGDADSQGPSMTPDGRFVAFESQATIFGDTHMSGVFKIYRKDTTTGAIIPASVTPSGGDPTPLNPITSNGSTQAALSADGSRIAYQSDCTNIVGGDTNQKQDVFLATVGAGGSITTVLVSHAFGGGPSNDNSADPAITGDGLWVAYDSRATNLIQVDANGGDSDVFVYSVAGGTTELDSVNSQGLQAANGESFRPSLSPDGRYLAFDSFADNLVPADTNGSSDVFLRDRLLGTTIRVSVDTAGNQAGIGDNSVLGQVSADGSTVALVTLAAFVNSDTNGLNDVYVRTPLH